MRLAARRVGEILSTFENSVNTSTLPFGRDRVYNPLINNTELQRTPWGGQ